MMNLKNDMPILLTGYEQWLKNHECSCHLCAFLKAVVQAWIKVNAEDTPNCFGLDFAQFTKVFSGLAEHVAHHHDEEKVLREAHKAGMN